MKFRHTSLKDAYIVEPQPFEDQRGRFSRIFCQNELNEIGLCKQIVQINHSMTRQKGAIRGMHYQKSPKAEIKMIRCIGGAVFDVIIDLRKNSETFLKWHGEVLSSENTKMMYVPEGFAHGFQTLEDDSELIYFHTEFYSPEYEGGIRYDDPMLNIEWKTKPSDISMKDRGYPLLSSLFEGVVLQ